MQKISDGKSILGFDENITAMLGYMMGLGAFVLLFFGKHSKFIKFHAVQSVLYSMSLSAILMLLIFIFRENDFQYLLIVLTAFAWMFGVIYALLMTYQKRYFKFPFIGNLAEKWSGADLE